MKQKYLVAGRQVRYELPVGRLDQNQSCLLPVQLQRSLLYGKNKYGPAVKMGQHFLFYRALPVLYPYSTVIL